MNKLKLLAPILGLTTISSVAVSLTSCGTTYYKVSIFGSNHISITVTQNEKGKDVLADIDVMPGYELEDLTITSGNQTLQKDTDYTFKNNQLVIKANSIDSDKVSILANELGNDWYTNHTYMKSLTQQDVGIIHTIKVNGIKHKVRLIDVDKDVIANTETKAHTTWEFYDLISDKNGYSLATFWNDTDEEMACKDYLNSSLRYALVGQGNPKRKGWYEKGSSTISTTYTQPVIDMLPETLLNEIKPVKKNVYYYDDVTETFIKKLCTDKLFLLSSDEIFSNNTASDLTGSQYLFYKDLPWSGDGVILGIKRQVAGWKDAQTEEKEVTDSLKSGDGNVSIAGYNSTDKYYEYHAGSGYWLRDIYTEEKSGLPAGGSSRGSFCYGFHGDGNTLAAPISPVFCI